MIGIALAILFCGNTSYVKITNGKPKRKACHHFFEKINASAEILLQAG